MFWDSTAEDGEKGDWGGQTARIARTRLGKGEGKAFRVGVLEGSPQLQSGKLT